jgi:hypothetical protein
MGLKNVPDDKTLTCGFVSTIAGPGQCGKGMGTLTDLAGPIVAPWGGLFARLLVRPVDGAS